MTLRVVRLGSPRVPSEGLRLGTVRTLEGRRWSTFAARYRREMRAPAAARAIELLALLSRQADMSVGCYCENERRCHRSVLRELLRDRGAKIAA